MTVRTPRRSTVTVTRLQSSHAILPSSLFGVVASDRAYKTIQGGGSPRAPYSFQVSFGFGRARGVGSWFPLVRCPSPLQRFPTWVLSPRGSRDTGRQLATSALQITVAVGAHWCHVCGWRVGLSGCLFFSPQHPKLLLCWQTRRRLLVTKRRKASPSPCRRPLRALLPCRRRLVRSMAAAQEASLALCRCPLRVVPPCKQLNLLSCQPRLLRSLAGARTDSVCPGGREGFSLSHSAAQGACKRVPDVNSLWR